MKLENLDWALLSEKPNQSPGLSFQRQKKPRLHKWSNGKSMLKSTMTKSKMLKKLACLQGCAGTRPVLPIRGHLVIARLPSSNSRLRQRPSNLSRIFLKAGRHLRIRGPSYVERQRKSTLLRAKLTM